MTRYKLAEGGVIRLDDMAFIPADPANLDWQEYQEWLAQGNQPEPMYTPQELKQKLKRDMLGLRQTRINKVLSHPNNQYDNLADVQFYANNGDVDAQNILTWYQTYDDLVWNWIDNDLPNIPDDQLETINVEQIENDFYIQSGGTW